MRHIGVWLVGYGTMEYYIVQDGAVHLPPSYMTCAAVGRGGVGERGGCRRFMAHASLSPVGANEFGARVGRWVSPTLVGASRTKISMRYRSRNKNTHI